MAYLGTVAAATGGPWIPTRFLWCWHEMLVAAERELGGEIWAPRIQGSQLVDQRNTAALNMEGEWFLTLDIDQEYSPDYIVRMVESQKAIAEEHGACDVLTAVCYIRQPPHEPSIWHFDPETDDYRPIIELGTGEYPLDKPWPIGGAGGGCLLIQRDVIERCVWELGTLPFSFIGKLRSTDQGPCKPLGGPDFCFARRCRELEVAMWCDPRIQVGHWTDRCITLADWVEQRDAVLEDPVRASVRGRRL